jgi:uncharacterized protein DUF4160
MRDVPRISQFYGIAIYMYFSDHPPPHFHAQYGGVEAVVAISDGAVIRGSIPDRALRLVREWLGIAPRGSRGQTGGSPAGRPRSTPSTPLP